MGGGQEDSALCQHGLTLAEALASPQLQELRPALPQPKEENLAGAARCAGEGSPGGVTCPPWLSGLGSGGEAAACPQPCPLNSHSFWTLLTVQNPVWFKFDLQLYKRGAQSGGRLFLCKQQHFDQLGADVHLAAVLHRG